jgi:uncharacterized protein YqhQ
MAEMLYTGTKAISLSAEISLGEEESLGAWGLALSIGTAILAVVGLFVALPLFAADLAEKYLGLSGGSRHLVEGLVRAGVFIGYIAVIGLWKEIARVFEYHEILPDPHQVRDIIFAGGRGRQCCRLFPDR